MVPFFVVVSVIFFLYGLVQWARGGAALWELRQISRGRKNATADDSETEEAPDSEIRGGPRRQTSARDLEKLTDVLLRSSFRVIGILAICVWVFVVFSVVVDMLGLDWLDNLSFRANRFWGNPAVRAGTSGSGGGNSRNNILRSLGSGVRR